MMRTGTIGGLVFTTRSWWAEHDGVTVDTVRWRELHQDGHPRGVNAGGAVLYLLEDVEKWWAAKDAANGKAPGGGAPGAG
jgi:hypothetical protein